MVSDADKFCEEVLLKDTPINRLVDKDGKKLTDKHLYEAVGEFLQLPVYDLYQKVCIYATCLCDEYKSRR